MVLRSNRSGSWRHIIGICRRLRSLCRKHSNNALQHHKTPVKSTLLSCDKNILWHNTSFMSHRSDIMLWLLYIFELQYMYIHFDYFCSITTQLFAAVVRYIIKHLFYETAWFILFWSHKNDVTSLVNVHRGHSPAARILHTKFDWACDVIFVTSK